MMFATCVPFPLGAGGEAGAFAHAADVPGPSSLQFAFVCCIGNAHLCEALPGPFGPGECVTGEAPCCPDECWVGWSVCVLAGWSCWGSCGECSVVGVMSWSVSSVGTCRFLPFRVIANG